MKIILSTESFFSAAILKEKIIKGTQKNEDSFLIETWSYKKSGDNYDIIYHDVPQYMDDAAKKVIFRVETDDRNVVLSTAWWANNPEPSHQMISLHVGRLTEMLLTHFSDKFITYRIIDF